MESATQSPTVQSTLESFNPATGELVGSVATITPEQVQGVVDDVARIQPAWAELSLQDRARYMKRAADALLDEIDEIAELLVAGAGQAPRRGLHDGAAADGRRAALVRQGRPEDPRRREGADEPGLPDEQERPLLLRADRRRRRDRALELPLVDPLRRGGDRADGRQRRGAEASQPDAAAGRGDPPRLREGRPARGPDPRRPRRRRGRRRAGPLQRRQDLLHRLGRGRPQGRRGLRAAVEGLGPRAGRQGPDDRLRRRRPAQRDLRRGLGRLRQRRPDLLGDRARLRRQGGGRPLRRGRRPRDREAAPRRPDAVGDRDRPDDLGGPVRDRRRPDRRRGRLRRDQALRRADRGPRPLPASSSRRPC